MTSQTPPPIARLKALLGRLVMDISAAVAWGGIAMPLHILITSRILDCLRRIERIAESIRAGTFRRRTGAPRPAASPRRRSPRPSTPVRQPFGWVMPLLPMQPWDKNACRGHLESLLADPEMVALIEAAPVSLGRPLRSLCWMFRIKPPAILVPPRRQSSRLEAAPTTTAPAAPSAPAAPAPPPPHDAASGQTHPTAIACGPSPPA